VIVVEGPPGSGKTVLAHRLAQELGIQCGGSFTTSRRAAIYMVLGWAVTGDQPIRVRDGFFFENVLGASLPGHRPQFSEGEVMYVRKILTALECPVIVCLPPWESVLKRAKDNPTNNLSDSQLEGLFLSYTNLILNSPGSVVVSHGLGSQPTKPDKVLWYDHTCAQEWTIPYTYILERCKDYIDKRKERTW